MRYLRIRKFIIKYHFYISFAIILIYLSPYLILWDKIGVPINDNLDSNVVWYKILTEGGYLSSSNNKVIPNMMSGLPRSSFGSEFQLILLLFLIFPPFVAYIINEFIIHIVAFLGMYLLLKNHFRINHGEMVNIMIIDGISICFAFIPFLPCSFLSIAGLPLALYAFLNIRFNKSTKIDWIILSLLPFHSFLILTFIFFIAIMFFIFLIDYVKSRNFNKKFFFAIFFFLSIYLLIEYRYVVSLLLDTGYTSQRTEFEFAENTFLESLNISIIEFFFGHKENFLYHPIIIFYSLSIIIISYILLRIFKNKHIMLRIFKNKNTVLWIFKNIDIFEIKPKFLLLVRLLILHWLISVIFGFRFWDSLSYLKAKFPILIIFRWYRFYLLSPLILSIMIAISLDISYFYIKNLKKLEKPIKLKIKNHNTLHFKISRISKPLMMSLVIYLSFVSVCISVPHSNIYEKLFNDEDYISYEGYYSEELFAEIRRDIKKSQKNYRIGCIGFEPAVAVYNGFYTIDGYHPNYPIEYKHRFRRLIEKELEKDEEIKGLFDKHASRCYIYVAKLGRLSNKMYKWHKWVLTDLELNVTALYDLEVDFIFSSVKINNSAANNLNLFDKYDNEVSIWKIFVYKVIS